MPRDAQECPATIDQILAIAPADVGDFLRRQINARTLSPIIAELNRLSLSPHHPRRQEAVGALRHLGFI